MEYLSGADAQKRLGEMGIAIPSYLEYSPTFFAAYPQYNMNIFLEEAENCAFVYPSSAFNTTWSDVMWSELVRAYNLEISVDEACDNISAQIG